jgi:hypothetical protein
LNLVPFHFFSFKRGRQSLVIGAIFISFFFLLFSFESDHVHNILEPTKLGGLPSSTVASGHPQPCPPKGTRPGPFPRASPGFGQAGLSVAGLVRTLARSRPRDPVAKEIHNIFQPYKK